MFILFLKIKEKDFNRKENYYDLKLFIFNKQDKTNPKEVGLEVPLNGAYGCWQTALKVFDNLKPLVSNNMDNLEKGFQ